MVTYEVTEVDDRPRLVRSNTVVGEVNEGAAKVANIQMALGRRPLFAAGNSHGDAMMLDYAMAHDGPSMAMLIDHDDGEREYAYESKAGSFESTEPVTAIAERSGWSVVSMRNDWNQIFRARSLTDRERRATGVLAFSPGRDSATTSRSRRGTAREPPVRNR